MAAAAAADPALAVGLFDHPLLTRSTAGTPTLETGRAMAVVMLGHGLLQQADGDPAALPDDLRTALAVARSMRNGSITASLHKGNELTVLATATATRWLTRLGDDRPDLVREVLDEILRDERAVMTRVLPGGTVARAETPATGWGEPFDAVPHQQADRFVVREQMKAPTMWLPGLVTPPGRDRDAPNPEVDVVAFAWSVPWERERTRRLVAFGLDPAHADAYRRLTRGRPGAGLATVRPAAPGELAAADQFVRACRRGLLVQLAARLYRRDRGAFPPDLPALVAAGFLPAVPPDPYSPTGEPLRYRVPATDETLAPHPAPGGARPVSPPAEVKAGQPVTWSIGPDGLDDGGRSHPVVHNAPSRAVDLVFLVPLPPTAP
ncbi:hypothetical protein J0H58_11380 [bacterium]|nr:hypothetical protein [bacterium]